MIKIPVEIKGKILRVRVKNPKMFRRGTFRTQDVGSRGHTMRVGGRLKSTGRWETQSWRFPVKDVHARRPETMKTLRSIGEYGRATTVVKAHYRKGRPVRSYRRR